MTQAPPRFHAAASAARAHARLSAHALILAPFLLLAGVLVFTPAPSARAGGPVEILTLQEVVPGLSGTGYTVVQGNKIEPFDVEVLGVLENASASGSLVFVRAGGELIERTGGIAAGMSGSPVYVDGRLLGAISHSFAYADQRFGLVTPAEDMMEVLELVLARRSRAAREGEGRAGGPARGAAVPGLWPPADDEGPPAGGASPGGEAAPEAEAPRAWAGAGARGAVKVAVAPDSASAALLQRRLGEGVWVASPVVSPLVASGFGPRAFDRVRALAESLDLLPVMGGPSQAPAAAQGTQASDATDGGAAPIRPGSALGVQLLRGDASLTAIGTVTHVQDGAFIALGHPVLNRGSAGYFASRADVLATVPGLMYPFKVASPGALVGAVVEDRSAGAGGLLGVLPESVALFVEVEDEDRGKVTSFGAWAVKDAALTVPLLAIGALEAVDRGIDRIGEGTAWVRFVVRGEGLPRPFVRSNTFYSEADIAAELLTEAYEALALLSGNEFQDPGLSAVEITARIEKGRRTARVVEAAPRAEKARPGEQVLVDVTLRPFREDPFTIAVPLGVPEWAAPGEVTVTVRGGYGAGESIGPPLGETLLPGAEAGLREDSALGAESLDAMIEELESRPKNSDLVLEFYPLYEPEAQGALQDEPGEAAVPGGPRPGVPERSVHPLDHVILGEVSFTLEIEPSEAAGAGEAPASR